MVEMTPQLFRVMPLCIVRIEADTHTLTENLLFGDGECCFDDCVDPHRVALTLYLSNGCLINTSACADHARIMLDSLPRSGGEAGE